MWKAAFKKFQGMVCLSRPYPLKYLKDCLPQNLLSPLLNTLSHLIFSNLEEIFQNLPGLLVAHLVQCSPSDLKNVSLVLHPFQFIYLASCCYRSFWKITLSLNVMLQATHFLFSRAAIDRNGFNRKIAVL